MRPMIVPLVMLLATLLSWQPARAQFAVEDVYVGAQATISALNSVRALVQQGIQIANEATIIQQQLEQLSYDAANLTQSPLQLVGDLGAMVERYEALLTQAGGLRFDVGGLQGQLRDLYPTLGQEVSSPADAITRVSGWLGQVRQSGLTAVEGQAVAPRLQAQRRNIQQALQASQAAPGALGVGQVTNQMLGVLAEQLGSLQQTIATSERVKTTDILTQTEIADQVAQEARRHVSGMGSMEPVQSIGIPAFR